jgi:hypothetical protein
MSEYVEPLGGEPMTGLRPPEEVEQQRLHQAQVAKSLAEIKALSREVAEAWTSDKSALELVAEQRR